MSSASRGLWGEVGIISGGDGSGDRPLCSCCCLRRSYSACRFLLASKKKKSGKRKKTQTVENHHQISYPMAESYIWPPPHTAASKREVLNEWFSWWRSSQCFRNKRKSEASARYVRGDAFQPLILQAPHSDEQAAMGSIMLQPFSYNVRSQIFIPLSTQIYLKNKKSPHTRNSTMEQPRNSVTMNLPHCFNKLNICHVFFKKLLKR